MPKPQITPDINCLRCQHTLSSNESLCSNCGWTYELNPAEKCEASEDSSPLCIQCLAHIDKQDHYCHQKRGKQHAARHSLQLLPASQAVE